MEIALVSPTSIRLKSKLASLVVDPGLGKTKVQADAILLLQAQVTDVDVEGSRLTLAGPGEYEVGGVKITGVKNTESTSYYLTLDGISVLIAIASSLKGKENLRDVDVAVFLSDSLVDTAALATVASGAAIFYGPMSAENIKALGKETQPVNKYVVTKDKLPAEMETILLQ